jgi:hypothetical protein
MAPYFFELFIPDDLHSGAQLKNRRILHASLVMRGLTEGLRLYRSSPYREFPAGIIMEVDATRAGRVSPLWAAARVQQALGGQDE